MRQRVSSFRCRDSPAQWRSRGSVWAAQRDRPASGWAPQQRPLPSRPTPLRRKGPPMGAHPWATASAACANHTEPSGVLLNRCHASGHAKVLHLNMKGWWLSRKVVPFFWNLLSLHLCLIPTGLLGFSLWDAPGGIVNGGCNAFLQQKGFEALCAPHCTVLVVKASGIYFLSDLPCSLRDGLYSCDVFGKHLMWNSAVIFCSMIYKVL